MIYFDIIDSQLSAILLARPNWESAVELEAYLLTKVSSVLEGQEDRHAMNERLRYRLKWMGLLDQGDLTNFRLGMARLKDHPVICPFWPEEEIVTSIVGAVITVDGSLTFTADRVIIYDRSGNYEILAANRGAQTANTITCTTIPAGSWSGEFYVAPLFIGVMKQRPNLTNLTDEAASIELMVEDMSAYDRALLPISGSVGTGGTMVPDFSTKPVFPFYPHHSSPTDRDELTIQYYGIGFLRDEQIAYYDALPKRGDELAFFIDTKEEAAAMLAFFVERIGPVKPFLLPTHRGDLRLSRNTESASATVYCEKNQRYHDEFQSVDKHPGTDFLALVSPAGIRVLQVDDTAIVGDELVLTVHENVGAIYGYKDTKVSFLHLSRFADTSIRISYTTNRVSELSVRFIECAEEYLELSGTGADTTKAILYKFYVDISGYTVWRYTSFERSITNTDGTYVPGPFEHGGLQNALNLADAKVTLKSFKFSGNPLQQLVPYAMEKPMNVEIYEVDAATPATSRTLFKGEIKNARVKGQVVEAECIAIGRALERKLPWFLFQRACNHDLFCPETCGVDPDDFEITGTIDALSSANFSVDVDCGDNSADQFFTQGWIETGTGTSTELRAILRSESLGGGVQRLFLHRPLTLAIVGQTVAFWPGCDKSYDGTNGCPKFGAGKEIRFGGFPFIPEQNPSIEAVPLQPGEARRK